MTPERIILGLLGDGSQMTRYDFEFHTGWEKSKVADVVSGMCAAGQIKSIKRNIFKRTDLCGEHV
jgi:hypothetical protein